MKHLKLNTTAYLYVIEQYAEWLQTLGYAPRTVYGLPRFLREFLHFLEQKEIYDLNQITPQHIQDYYHYVKHRKRHDNTGALANATINNQRRMLVSFTNYLRQSGRMIIPAIEIRTLNERKEKLNTLSEEEIKLLFKATYSIDELQQQGRPPLGERDRAMLALYYGCGLRRSEGVNIKLEDIDSSKQSIYVKKGKGYKERLVPVHNQYLHYIEEYIYNSRYLLLNGNKSGWLLISQRGNKIDHQSLSIRLKILTKQSNNEGIIQKAPTLHTLRHSIATHLLHRNVNIEQIARFLGHSSIESTQVYLHNNIE